MTDLLKEHRDHLEVLAQLLLKQEVVSKDDLIRLLGQRQWKDESQYQDIVDEAENFTKKMRDEKEKKALEKEQKTREVEQ